MSQPEPIKLCECGCGQPAPIASQTNTAAGHVKGKPLRFVSGHNARGRRVVRKRMALEERFWPRVDVRGSDDCWEWLACKGFGYGLIGAGGKHGGMLKAHRVAYELLIGPIPRNLHIDHLCRNRACVNPAHLEPVTPRENMRRGVGWSGRNARKTHCPQGHPYSGDNLYVPPGGGRKCRACHRERVVRAYRSRHQGTSEAQKR